jgi:peptide-methionine (S)-S-oxide reductase
VDYDPSIISYDELVGLFFDFHNETLRPYDQRVKSIIFYRSEEEEVIARDILDDIRVAVGDKGVFTEVKGFKQFYLAEAEHQLRALKMEPSLYRELTEMYGSDIDIEYSVLGSKLNAFVSGRGDLDSLEMVLSQSALSEASKDRLRDIVMNPSENYK